MKYSSVSILITQDLPDNCHPDLRRSVIQRPEGKILQVIEQETEIRQRLTKEEARST